MDNECIYGQRPIYIYTYIHILLKMIHEYTKGQLDLLCPLRGHLWGVQRQVPPAMGFFSYRVSVEEEPFLSTVATQPTCRNATLFNQVWWYTKLAMWLWMKGHRKVPIVAVFVSRHFRRSQARNLWRPSATQICCRQRAPGGRLWADPRLVRLSPYMSIY